MSYVDRKKIIILNANRIIFQCIASGLHKIQEVKHSLVIK